MLSHTGTLWHYLGSFIIYTLAAIGLIYAAYCYARKSSSGGKSLLGLGKKASGAGPRLSVESTLPLEPRKTLYVVCSGNERFLIAASGETTQLLSKLEETPQPMSAMVATTSRMEEDASARPWYADGPMITRRPKAGLGSRFVQSVQWLVSSRSGK